MARFLLANGWVRCALVATIALSAATVSADEPKRDRMADVATDLRTGQRPAAITIDAIMDRAVQNIATRYNLNSKQTELTRELMRRDVYRFLEDHEREVWPVIRKLLESQLRTPEDPEDMKWIGEAAGPLAKLAEQAIYDANEEWRLILTPDQVKVHDFDMAEMKSTFKEIHKNLDDWQAGRATPRGIFPEPDMTGDPARPSKPPVKGPIIVVFDPKHIFERVVEEFIKEHGLDKGQITAARSILW